MRPEYETEQDRLNEARVADRIAEWRGVQIRKTPRFYPLDYAIEKKGRIVAMAEIKCRTFEKDKYPTYMLSLHKAVAGRNLSQMMSLPAWLFVEWDGGLVGCMDLATQPDFIQWGGRTDRADPQDMEPCAHWSIEEHFRFDLDA